MSDNLKDVLTDMDFLIMFFFISIVVGITIMVTALIIGNTILTLHHVPTLG